jgi:rsbT co-antagonist protein RsbR
MVAQQIFNVLDALKIIGVNSIITGIRPEIAQTVVSLGIDFSKQVTRANLQQALIDVQLFPK